MKKITDDIWEETHDVRLPGGIYFNARMTVVDVGDGELLLHSPVPIDDPGAIRALGDVRWIVAPNDLHHLYVGQAARHFPQAEVWGSPGARKKQRDVEFAGALEEAHPDTWNGRVVPRYIDGTRGWCETVFHLPRSRTLLCSDLVFNIHETVNRRTRWLLALVGAFGAPRQSASVRWLFTKDRTKLGRAYADILAWDFDRVVMGHGRIVEEDAHRVIAPALSWALPSAIGELPA